MVHPEPGHLVLQLVGRIERAPQGAVVDFRGAPDREPPRFAHGLDLLVGRQLVRLLPHADLRGPRRFVGCARNRERVDALLHSDRQLARGRGMQLRVQVAFRADLLHAGQFRGRGAPGHAVDQRRIARFGVDVRLGQGAGGQRKQ
ncbi:hypothetical protein D9M68_656820 [compost metagenome]